jgi:transaldolase
MIKTSIQELNEFGQSVWFDNISRSMIKGGKIKEMISQGLRGITSNPTIFDKAISKSSDYNEQIQELARNEKTTFEIYDDLTIKDIQDALDVFKPVYDDTNMLDGYVSLEINPKLARMTKETIQEGKRLYKKVNRPNLMLKVPSTEDSFAAVCELSAAGINVNVTLIFSLEQYINSVKSYLEGIKRFAESGGDVCKVHSVASVFISRIDTLADKMLDEKIKKESDSQIKNRLNSLKGKAAVANSKLIYKKYLEFCSSNEFKALKAKGANMQRLLWGSTSTKNPVYSDIKYVVELIGKNTVNTMPDATYEAYLDHGRIEESLNDNVKDAQDTIEQLRGFDIDIDKVCAKLLEDGVAAFESSFESLLHSIDEKRNKLCSAK